MQETGTSIVIIVIVEVVLVVAGCKTVRFTWENCTLCICGFSPKTESFLGVVVHKDYEA